LNDAESAGGVGGAGLDAVEVGAYGGDGDAFVAIAFVDDGEFLREAAWGFAKEASD
jgi:hypothetical protein